MVLSNLRQNQGTLREIRGPLADAGIHLAACLLDDHEKLYTCDFQPTYEPVFSKEYLRRVLRGMWEVCTPVFGVSEFSYGDLASQVCDRDIEKIRLAVQRIAITARSPKGEGYLQLPIWAGPSQWQWRLNRDNKTSNCNFATLQQMLEVVDRLQPPCGMSSEQASSSL
jgi:hypothetical protein